MTNPILLVHGSWHGGWIWQELERALVAEGHDVLAPCLCGLGSKAAHLVPTIGLWTHVEQLEALVKDHDLNQLILVGHSYGGTVVHALEGRIARRLVAVVHLEGAIPAPGSAIIDDWQPAFKKSVIEAAAAHGGWRIPPPDPANIWPELSKDQRLWLQTKLTDHPLQTYLDRLPVDLKLFAGPHYYLFAHDRPNLPYGKVVARLRNQANWTITSTSGGHELPLTNQAAVLELIRLAGCIRQPQERSDAEDLAAGSSG